MIKIFISFIILFNNCGSKKNSPDPEQQINLNEKDINTINFNDSLNVNTTKQFYELEETIDKVQKQIIKLQSQIDEYEFKTIEDDYTKKLKELINTPPPSHKINLKNGSIIKGTIEKDRSKDILVITELGKLTIKKNEIESIKDLLYPIPDIEFLGHGKEEKFDNYYLFTGKVINQGNRKADFVRVIYHLWAEDTKLINSDSSFISGTEIVYKSGIITDTVLEAKNSAYYTVKVDNLDKISVSYITREVRWSLYD